MKITTMKSMLSILFLAFEGVSCFTPISTRNGRFETKITQQAAVIDLSSPMNITALNKGLCDEVMFKQGVQTIQEARSKQKESEYQVAPDVLEDLRSQSIMDLKLLCSKRSIRYKGLEEHEEFVQAIVDNIKELKDFSVSGHLVPGVFNEISADILEQEMKSDKPLLLDVYATFCGPCKLVEPEFEVVARRLGKNCRVAKLDSQKYHDVATRFKVQGLPATLLIRKGKIVSRREGLVSRDQLMDFVDPFLPKKSW